MILRLRRRHRRLTASLFVLLAIAAILALTHRSADPVSDTWPEALSREP